jgi:hypothetical protein
MIAAWRYLSVQAGLGRRLLCSRGSREAGSRRFAEKMRLTLLLLQPIAPRLDLDQRQDDVAVALAGPAHGPQMVEDSRLDVDEELPAASLYRPQGRVPGGR